MKKYLALALSLLLLAGCTGKDTQVASVTTLPETTEATEATISETTVPETTEAPTETEAPSETVDAQVVATADPVITEAQNTVYVSTADEFLKAIAPNTDIVVDAELIDFSTATGYGKTNGDYYRWDDPFDGPELILCNLTNVTVRGSGQERTDVTLSAVPRYADVLTFENSANIYVTNITLGHTKEPGSCIGGVLNFVNSQDVLVENCDLYGCGTVGVGGENSLNMQVYNCLIHDCSVGGLSLTNCQNVRVDCTTFRNLGDKEFPEYEASIFRMWDCENVTMDGAEAVPFQPFH